MNSFFSVVGWIPKDARLIPLSELLETVIDHRGKTPRKLGGDWVESGIPAISAKNVHDGVLTNKDAIRYVSRSIYKKWMKEDVKKGDVLLASEGASMGEYLYWDYDYPIVLSQRLFCLRADNKKLNDKYLYAFIRSESFQKQLLGRATGTSVLGVRQSTLLEILVPIIDYHIQEFIGNTIYELDKKIELNRQMNQTLEAMAQTLFKSWFVDFDPVIDNALAAGNQIPAALQARAEKRKALLDRHSEGGTTEESPQYGAPLFYSNPALAALFPSSFEYNETLDKWIPEGWEVKSVGDLATVVGGGTPSTSVDEYYTDNGIPWLSPKDLSGYEWKYISKGAKDITELGLKKSSAKMMPSGTVVFSSRAPIGYVAIAKNDLCTNQGFKSLIPNKEVPSEYLYQFLKTNVEQIESIASGSTFKEVSGSAIKGFSILKPSKEILARFAMIIESGNKKGLVNQKETETLTQLRDTLLPQLISGKVRVPEEVIGQMN